MADKKTNIAAKVRAAVEALIIDAGYSLWDVAYYKEGSEMILEISIDKKGGISINDCSVVTKLIEPVIDELDPIEEAYYLQVSSAGMVRPLNKHDHLLFAVENNLNVTVGLYVAVDGKKEFVGVIDSFDGESIVLSSEGKSYNFTLKQISKINAEFEAEESAETDKENNDE